MSDSPAQEQPAADPAGHHHKSSLATLAVSAIAGCETCIQAHEKVVVDGGLTPEQVHEAVRIAATVNAVATARALARPPEIR